MSELLSVRPLLLSAALLTACGSEDGPDGKDDVIAPNCAEA